MPDSAVALGIRNPRRQLQLVAQYCLLQVLDPVPPRCDCKTLGHHAGNWPAVRLGHLHPTVLDVRQIDCVIDMLPGVQVPPFHVPPQLEHAGWWGWPARKRLAPGNPFRGKGGSHLWRNGCRPARHGVHEHPIGVPACYQLARACPVELVGAEGAHMFEIDDPRRNLHRITENVSSNHMEYRRVEIAAGGT